MWISGCIKGDNKTEEEVTNYILYSCASRGRQRYTSHRYKFNRRSLFQGTLGFNAAEKFNCSLDSGSSFNGNGLTIVSQIFTILSFISWARGRVSSTDSTLWWWSHSGTADGGNCFAWFRAWERFLSARYRRPYILTVTAVLNDGINFYREMKLLNPFEEAFRTALWVSLEFRVSLMLRVPFYLSGFWLQVAQLWGTYKVNFKRLMKL